MKLIPLTQGYFTKVDDADFDEFSKFSWNLGRGKTNLYAKRSVINEITGKKGTVLMHRKMMGVTDPSVDVDHGDNDGLNNQRYNLRVCSRSQNNGNSRAPTDNTSGFKGVHYDKSRCKWSAGIAGKGLGRFDSKEEAARHYNRAAKEKWAEFAKLNNVEPLFPTTEKPILNPRNTSGFTGVHLDSKGKWRATIIRNGINKRFGPFSNKEDAVMAYKNAESEFNQKGFLEIMTTDSMQSWKGSVPCCFYRFEGQKRLKRISNKLAAELFRQGKFEVTDMCKKWFVENGLLPKG